MTIIIYNNFQDNQQNNLSKMSCENSILLKTSEQTGGLVEDSSSESCILIESENSFYKSCSGSSVGSKIILKPNEFQNHVSITINSSNSSDSSNSKKKTNI